jgi:hypothetical protein
MMMSSSRRPHLSFILGLLPYRLSLYGRLDVSFRTGLLLYGWLGVGVVSFRTGLSLYGWLVLIRVVVFGR